MANTNITIRIDEKLKSDLQELLEKLGLDMTTFFVMTAKQAVREQAIPFLPSIFSKEYDKLCVEFFEKNKEYIQNNCKKPLNKDLDDLSYEEFYKLIHQKK